MPKFTCYSSEQLHTAVYPFLLTFFCIIHYWHFQIVALKTSNLAPTLPRYQVSHHRTLHVVNGIKRYLITDSWY